MGRRMGLAGGSAVPVMPSSSPMMASSAAAAMTPLMSRTDSEASTSSTSTNSSVNTNGSADAFRFDDDEDEDLEEVDTEYESEVEEDDYYPSSSSAAVAGSSSSGSIRGSGHSSCPSNSSLDSFTLPRDCFPSSSSSAASLASFSIASSSSSSASSQASSSKATRIETPYTFPCPTPISELRPNDLEACLRFSSSSNGSILPSSSSDEESAPPAFFPLQRVSFAPQLKIKTHGGVPLAMSGSGKDAQQHGISGMMLGVTGTVQILDAEKSRKAGR